MGVKEHYDSHLGNFYSWMAGDITTKADEFFRFLRDRQFAAANGDTAIDLGAGHGIQSIALARCGYRVTAIDFNPQLLEELARNAENYAISIVNDDLRQVRKYADSAAVVVCCGDTLTHLDSITEIRQLVNDVYHGLRSGGKAIFSFRDYTIPLVGVNRFIPVKSDHNRILTCVLDYQPESVTVTDLLHERDGDIWRQSASAYQKVRLNPDAFMDMFTRAGFKDATQELINRLVTVIAVK
jgi:ubiquinone/menaquinone biosynthesis C-methylase UbiE